MNVTPNARLPDDAMDMLCQYQRSGSAELADELVRRFEPLVQMAAHKISRSRPDLLEDLVQVGRMTLFRLLKLFDPDYGMPFEPYAMKSIIGQMKNFLRDKSWYVQVPRRIKEKGLILQQAVDELTMELERSPNVQEIADRLGISLEETLEVLAGRELYHYVSLDVPVSEEENGATLGDLIAATTDEYAHVDRKLDLDEEMMRLKPEERKVLVLLYEHGFSQRNVADRLGVSQMSVSRIQRRAIGQLKKWLTNAGGSGSS